MNPEAVVRLMSEPNQVTEAVGEGAISGNQASIPAAIRERADIEDGDRLRWRWHDGDLSIEVVRRRTGVFAEFEGFDGESESFNHDRVGLEPAGEFDAGTNGE
jgi:bifunctional DNA-binding transcriptional regulator/antitoxin component of YhaV-PrlF toxin-antitoxin module